jgi:hypothetical protein
LLELCALNPDDNSRVQLSAEGKFKTLTEYYASRNRTALLDKLRSITVNGGCLVRGDKIILPGELWAFASNYAGAALGLGQVLGRPVAAESIQDCLAAAKFDVEGHKLGSLTLASIRVFTMHNVSTAIAEAARIARASDNKEPSEIAGAYGIKRVMSRDCSVFTMFLRLIFSGDESESDADSGATKRTGLGALLATTSSEYRRLLKLPGLENLTLSFVRAMRASRFGKLCPIERATKPGLDAMGDMNCTNTTTLVIDGPDIPALLQGVIQCSAHCFNFDKSCLMRDGGVASYFSCMYLPGLATGVTCDCGNVGVATIRVAKLVSVIGPAQCGGNETVAAASGSLPSQQPAVAASEAAACASEGASSSTKIAATAKRIHRAISKRADPVPCRCGARGCTSRLTFVYYQGFGLAVIRRTPHSTHSSSSLCAVARDTHELPLHPATMIFALSHFSSTGSAPTNITDRMQVRHGYDLAFWCIVSLTKTLLRFFPPNAATNFRCTTTRL